MSSAGYQPLHQMHSTQHIAQQTSSSSGYLQTRWEYPLSFVCSFDWPFVPGSSHLVLTLKIYESMEDRVSHDSYLENNSYYGRR